MALLKMELSNEDRLWAIGMLEAGLYTPQVAACLGTSERSDRRLRNRFIKDRQRSGRPKVITHAEDQRIVTIAISEKLNTVSKIRETINATTRGQNRISVS